MENQRASSLKLKSPLLPILVGVLLFMQLIEPYKGWILLLAGLGGAWLISYLWARTLARHLSIHREMRFGWAQVGDRLEERFTVKNAGWLTALWIEIEDHSTLPDYQPGRATGVGNRSEISWRTYGACTRRGVFSLGPTSLSSGDPLGIYSVRVHDQAFVNLMVTPPIVPLPAIEVAAGGRAGKGHARPDAPERTVSASSVREYSPGDSLRWIHWRTSARRDALHVRLFESTPSSDWWIILDMDSQAQVGQGQSSTEEHGVILAASLADRGLRLGHAVGMVMYGETITWLPPQEGSERRWAILRALALVKPGRLSLAELLTFIRPDLEQRASLVLITPNPSGDWLESLLPLIWRGAAPTTLLLDPLSFGGNGDLRPLLAKLSEWGIPRYKITRDLLDQPEAHPGQAGQWEWRVMPTGRAVPVRRPRDLTWKTLS